MIASNLFDHLGLIVALPVPVVVDIGHCLTRRGPTRHQRQSTSGTRRPYRSAVNAQLWPAVSNGSTTCPAGSDSSAWSGQDPSTRTPGATAKGGELVSHRTNSHTPAPMRSTANPLGHGHLLGMPSSTCSSTRWWRRPRRRPRPPDDPRGAGVSACPGRCGIAVTAQANGPIVAGTAVVLTGEWLEAALQAVLIAARARTRNGLPNSAAHLELAKAFTAAMSASGRSDVREAEQLQHYPQQEPPTVTIEDAARQLAVSERQARRLAPKLGGKKIDGQWFLDQDAINEHKEGLR